MKYYELVHFLNRYFKETPMAEFIELHVWGFKLYQEKKELYLELCREFFSWNFDNSFFIYNIYIYI